MSKKFTSEKAKLDQQIGDMQRVQREWPEVAQSLHSLEQKFKDKRDELAQTIGRKKHGGQS